MHPCHAGRVEADAALLHSHRDVADAVRTDVLEMRVDGAAFHVLRMLCDLPRAPSQHRVRLWRPVAGKDLDRLSRSQLAIDLPDDVEQVRVHLGRLVDPPVPHEPVELIEHRLVVDPVDHKGERAFLADVRVGKDDRARVAVGDGGFGRVRREPSGEQNRRRRRPRRRPAASRPLHHRQPRQPIILPNCGASFRICRDLGQMRPRKHRFRPGPNRPLRLPDCASHARLGRQGALPVTPMLQQGLNRTSRRIDLSLARFNLDFLPTMCLRPFASGHRRPVSVAGSRPRRRNR